jgi:hypothetical protein
MRRQDDPVTRRLPPPPTLPPHEVKFRWRVLVREVRHVRRRIRRFRRTHDDVSWALLGCVIAVGVGFLVGHF